MELDDIIGARAFAADPAVHEAGGSPSAWRYRLTAVRHYRGVYGLARALLGDAAEAEDVTQETFIRYWQHGATVRRPREWLMQVARNGCLDRLRRSGRFVATPDDELPETRDERDPGWHYEQRELADRLGRAIAGLGEPQKSLVLLFDVQGMSMDECARVIGINVNQVKVYLHRARRRLRLELEDSR